MTDSTASNALEEFLKLAIRRLWLIAFVDILRDGLWVFSGLLLMISAVHIVVTPVTSTVLWLITAPVIAVTLIRGAFKRPLLAKSAVEIDRRFSAGALISTAVECLQTPVETRGPAATIVLTQANNAARKWRHNIKLALVPRERVSSVAALVPLFIAVFLLSKSGTGADYETVSEATIDMRQSGPALVNENNDALDPVEQLRRELSARKATASATEPSTQNLSQAQDTDGANWQLDAPPTGLAGQASPNADDGIDSAGDAAANTSEAGIFKDVQMEQTQLFAVQRSGKAIATQTSDDLNYDDNSGNTSLGAAAALPAAPPESAKDRSMLNAAQAAYASRYLEATGENND